MTPGDDLEPAAGGLVQRSRDGAIEIALVRRIRHGGDTTLPKGHLQAGESWEEAALREVHEEVGCHARIVEPEPPPSAR